MRVCVHSMFARLKVCYTNVRASQQKRLHFVSALCRYLHLHAAVFFTVIILVHMHAYSCCILSPYFLRAHR